MNYKNLGGSGIKISALGLGCMGMTHAYGARHNADSSLSIDSRPETIRKSVEGSLKRLDTDYIDLYYQHRIDPNVPPEEAAGIMQDLIREGKIRTWGISEAGDVLIQLQQE